jgi:preprotein translocase subunit YajC
MDLMLLCVKMKCNFFFIFLRKEQQQRDERNELHSRDVSESIISGPWFL